ncbi:hypothetical protein [uncultured Pseudacidovorax sp.]|uniref:DUF6970 domain-containing protein n=1 Tax=uncultured Pseudacidovorax sp. TaxID=679313 RepID=UPI0025DBB191|nr:hypothetical protein [uncultured Pseudacidovorax sp.]
MHHRALRHWLLPILFCVLAGCASRHEDEIDIAYTGYSDERVVQEIRRLEANPSAKPTLPLHRVQYLGRRAYLLTSPCCDQFNYLYSAEGVLLCAPSGGLTGRGDGKCLGEVK